LQRKQQLSAEQLKEPPLKEPQQNEPKEPRQRKISSFTTPTTNYIRGDII